jgi:hypothetical protein
MDVERIAGYLGRFPALKRTVKYLWQAAAFVLNYHRRRYQGGFGLERVTGESGGFFGYYDKCPESPDGSRIIFHELAANDNSFVNVVLINADGSNRKVIAQTQAFNYQMGARLHWLDNNRFIFNDWNKDMDHVCGYIYSCSDEKLTVLHSSIFDTCNDLFITLEFDHLTAIGSEYGYHALPAVKSNTPSIYTGSLTDGNSEVIISTGMIRTQFPDWDWDHMTDLHFNHLMFEPSGRGFIFLMRFRNDQGKNHRLFFGEFKVQGSKFKVQNLKLLNSEMTSHYCWIDNRTVLGFMTHKGKPGYYKVDIMSGVFSPMEFDRHLTDGHPGYKSGLMLTDSYPKADRMQELYLIRDKHVMLVARFFAPLNFNESNRCDLHPRFSAKGDSVYIDSLHQGKRHLFRLNLKTNE